MELTLDNWKNEFYHYFVEDADVVSTDYRASDYIELIEKLLELQRQATIAEKDKEFVRDMIKNLDLVDKLSPPWERTTKLREYISYKYSPSPESNTEEGMPAKTNWSPDLGGFVVLEKEER